MRIIICLAVVAALLGLTGCAKHEPAPADPAPSQPEASVEPQPIASEDFESGEAEGVVESGDQTDKGAEPEKTP